MLAVLELFDRGDPSFVEELRKCVDADQLGAFAAKWHADRRPVARQFLFDYLDRPLNAFRHEALVKRLFKLAEKACDDELMARFLVAFDRSVRRVKKRRLVRNEHRLLDDREQASAMVRQWDAEGAERANLHDYGGRYQVTAGWWPKSSRWETEYCPTELAAQTLALRWRQEGAQTPTIRDMGGRYSVSATWYGDRIRTPASSAMPRGKKLYETKDWRTKKKFDFTDLHQKLGIYGSDDLDLSRLPERSRAKLAKLRLFSLKTRRYLRRRVWRYFRILGKRQPERYVVAAAAALRCYTDADVSDGLALLDNWGLMHILFHASPVVVAKTNGWTLAPDRALPELAPAPIFEDLWRQSPRSILDLLGSAKSRPVRQWAARMLRSDASILRSIPLDELLALLGHEDDEVVALAAEALRGASGLDKLELDRWLTLLESPLATAIDVVCELMAAHLKPERITFEQAAKLAMARPLPVARLGLQWLRGRTPDDEKECRSVLDLAEAQAEPIRAELIRWACAALGSSPHFRPDWAVEFLDSRHEDVRDEGWAWLQSEARVRDDVNVWRKLLESPYDDVRSKLIRELENRVRRVKRDGESLPLEPELVRSLWASALLNIHRGGRSKPVVVAQIVRRLERRPDEAPALLPVLAVALRSARGPEWRSGLSGIVQAVERRPELAAVVSKTFPEMRLTEAVTG